jgi:hypothetical protein
MENWAGQDDKQISSLTMLMKQAANLMVFQKYFDQWDYSLKLLGDKMLSIVLNNWNAEKVGLLIGEEPSPHFYSKIFAKYQVIVEEGLLTPTQKNFQAQQMLEINERFGREVLPPSMIIKDMNIQGKAEIMQFLQQQEQQQQQIQQEQMMVQHNVEDAKIKELYSKAAANIATAKERAGRAEADVGLFEERLSEITHNRAMATKAKMEALEKLMNVVSMYGQMQADSKMAQVDSENTRQEKNEDREKADAKQTAASNDFMMKILGEMSQQGKQGQQQGQQQEPMAQNM